MDEAEADALQIATQIERGPIAPTAPEEGQFVNLRQTCLIPGVGLPIQCLHRERSVAVPRRRSHIQRGCIKTSVLVPSRTRDRDVPDRQRPIRCLRPGAASHTCVCQCKSRILYHHAVRGRQKIRTHFAEELHMRRAQMDRLHQV